MKNLPPVHLLFSVVIIAASVFVSSLIIASAVSPEDIVYPVADLGNCRSKLECKSFCEKPQNFEVCISFAEEHNLIPSGELQKVKKFMELGEGPGGCTTPSVCENYCNDVSNIEECITFAEEHNLIPPDELEEARKVRAALRSGARLPGGCRNKAECENYCSDPSHMEECITFAEAAGFIPPDELDEARKVLQAVKRGVRPPACGGKDACGVYCGEPEHAEECITFAEAAGLIPPEELENAKKLLEAIKKGVKPPNCRGKEDCEVYCSEPEHSQECINFAEAAGFMSSEDAAMARKTGGKGPGGCKSKEECEGFCQDPVNQETCFNFAKEHGLIPESELREMGPPPTGPMPGSMPPEMMPPGEMMPPEMTPPPGFPPPPTQEIAPPLPAPPSLPETAPPTESPPLPPSESGFIRDLEANLLFILEFLR